MLIRSAAIAFAEWRPFLFSLILAGAGGRSLAALLASRSRGASSRPVAALAQATRRLAAGEEGVTVPAAGRGRAGRPRPFVQPHVAAAGRGPDRTAPLPGVGVPRAAHPADLDPRLRRGARGGSGGPRGGRRGSSAPRPGASSGSWPTCSTSLALAVRASRCRAIRSIWGPWPRAPSSATSRPRRRSAYRSPHSAVDPAPALGDEDRLLQVISNLIENALRLTPEGGSVHVQAGRGAARPSATPGPGFAPEDLPRAFERFYLHDRYRSERPVGSGLGLAIVQELVQAMHGSVSAAAAPGRGAEFVVRLPAADRADAGAAGDPGVLTAARDAARRARRRPSACRDGAGYAGTLREARCWPTLRLTRCRALSTVLQSQPRRRPTSS